MNNIQSQLKMALRKLGGFPLPLKVSIPVLLALVTAISSVYSYHQEIYIANQRVTQKLTEQAKFLGGKTSALLEFIYRTANIDGTDLEGANLAISQIGGEPNLTFALLLDPTEQIILASRYELRGLDWQTVLQDHKAIRQHLTKTQQSLAGQVRLAEDKHSLQLFYPVRFPSKSGQFRSKNVGVLVLDYDLSTQQQLVRQDALWRVLQTHGILAFLYLGTWLFLDRFITRRVTKITDGLEHWSQGNLSNRILLGGSDELSTIAAAFNRMAGQLEAEAEALSKTNQSLQAEVMGHKLTENSLRATEERFRVAIANAPFPIMIHTTQGEVLQVNKSWVERSEYPPALFPTVDDWIRLAHVPPASNPITPSRTSWNEGEVTLSTLSGQERHWIFQWASLGNLADGRDLIISMAADVTQRYATEKELRHVERERQTAETSLRQVIEGTAPITGEDFFPALVSQIAAALEVRFVSITKAMPEGFQGLAFCADGELQPPSFFPYSDVPCCIRALKQGEFCVPDHIPKLYPNNELFQSLEIQSYLGMALQNSQGQAIGNLCILHDQPLPNHEWAKTFLRIFAARAGSELERYQTSLDLEQLNQTLESKVLERTELLQQTMEELQAFKSAIDQSAIVATTDVHGVITSVNERFCDISGYTRDELIGKTHRLINSNHHPKEFFHQLWKTINQGKLWRGEVCNQTKEGSLYWVDSVIIPFLNERRQPYQFLAIRFDITARKQIETQLNLTNSELLRATRLKDEFLANMSHELRTPLNSILGLTEALHDEVFGEMNETQITMMKTIESSGSHLLELINDILDLAKVESGTIELEKQDTNINLLCQLCLTFIKQQAYKKRIKIHNQVPEDLPEIHVDERRMRQVLINLLNNAVKFTPEKGEITLRAKYVEISEENLEGPESLAHQEPFIGYLKISVIDTGIGIAPEHIKNLFQPFIQVDSALNRQYSGTGLGLALVKSIVELHGGQVTLSSQVNMGSCFEVELPCYKSKMLNRNLIEKHSASKDLQYCPPEPEAPKDILLVEDNEANIVTISSYLSTKGYQVQIAHNGIEAIQSLKIQSPDIILMDIQMPEMDGFETMRKIRTENLSSVPIIALTALAMENDQEKCIEAGATAYLSKPVKLKKLASLIQQHLRPEPLTSIIKHSGG